MLKGRTVVIGVTGSIAAYKMADVASSLVKMHAEFLGKIVHGPNAVAGLFRRSRIDMIHNENHTIRIKHLADADFTS